MIGLMIPSAFATHHKPILSFVDQTIEPSHYVKRYITEPNYKDWFDAQFPKYTIWEGIGVSEQRYSEIIVQIHMDMLESGSISNPFVWELTNNVYGDSHSNHFDIPTDDGRGCTGYMWIANEYPVDIVLEWKISVVLFNSLNTEPIWEQHQKSLLLANKGQQVEGSLSIPIDLPEGMKEKSYYSSPHRWLCEAEFISAELAINSAWAAEKKMADK